MTKCEIKSTKNSSSRRKKQDVFQNTSLGIHANTLDLCIRIYVKHLAHTCPFILSFSNFLERLRNSIVGIHKLCTKDAFNLWRNSLLPVRNYSNTKSDSSRSQMKTGELRAFAVYQGFGKKLLGSVALVFNFACQKTSGSFLTDILKKSPYDRDIFGITRK